jgi:hypothetical protein
MDIEALRLECLKLAIEHGEALDNAPRVAQRLLSFILDNPETSSGPQTLSVSVE